MNVILLYNNNKHISFTNVAILRVVRIRIQLQLKHIGTESTVKTVD